MHHFTKYLKKRLWYHLLLPLGSALITVGIIDIVASFSWFYKNAEEVVYIYNDTHYGNHSGLSNIAIPEHIAYTMLDILYWVWVTYRVILSLVICVGGIFMGRRPTVIIWLIGSILVDLLHLSETIFILSKPTLVSSWPLLLSVASSIWGEGRVVRIKYRIIRRTINADWNNNQLVSYEPSASEMVSDKEEVDRLTVFLVNFIKLVRNLYNLLTWHLTGFLFGAGDLHDQLMTTNYKAVFLEQKVLHYIRIFLDALAVVYILQEKKLLQNPWVTLHIFTGSAIIATFLFILVYLKLLTLLLMGIYYLVFAIDLFFRFGFFFFCLKLIFRSKALI